MIFGFVRKENIFLLQHYHPIRHIHCQIAVSEFPTDFDSWDMLTIIGSQSPVGILLLLAPPPTFGWLVGCRDPAYSGSTAYADLGNIMFLQFIITVQFVTTVFFS